MVKVHCFKDCKCYTECDHLTC